MTKLPSGPWSLAALALTAGVVGYAAATIQQAEPTPRVSPAAGPDAAASALRARVASLEEQLRAEQARHDELRADLEWMTTRLNATAAGVETLLEEASAGAAPAPEAAAGAGDARPPQAHPDAQRDQRGGERVEEMLVRAGFDRGEVEAYRARLADLEMERLYLANEAAREGWLGTERYRDELDALNGEIHTAREEFGEDLHDWGLYSAGRPNRAQVASVIAGSPAEAAGIAIGDIILAYGGVRVLSVGDVQQLTREGRVGESTRVELQRGDEVILALVPRGPLGVRLRPTRRQPSPARSS